MASLSVVVITNNEEAHIGACLSSVAWADELIVMDSGSMDGTMDISRDMGARVFQQSWLGYAAQKNAAMALATKDWILSLDADERVTPELAAAIRHLLAGPTPRFSGYRVRRKVFYRDKWLRYGGFYPERLVRLVKRGQARFGDRAVHESLEVDGPVGNLEYDIEHYTYRGVADYVDRLQKYSSLAAEEYVKAGRSTGPWRMAGRALFTFFQMYFLRLGFLDGYEGFLMAVLYAFYTFVKYAKLREMNQEARIG